MEVVRRLQPADFQWRSSGGDGGSPVTYTLDRLAGTDAARAAVEAGTVRDLLVAWEQDAQRFREMRRSYLLY